METIDAWAREGNTLQIWKVTHEDPVEEAVQTEMTTPDGLELRILDNA